MADGTVKIKVDVQDKSLDKLKNKLKEIPVVAKSLEKATNQAKNSLEKLGNVSLASVSDGLKQVKQDLRSVDVNTLVGGLNKVKGQLTSLPEKARSLASVQFTNVKNLAKQSFTNTKKGAESLRNKLHEVAHTPIKEVLGGALNHVKSSIKNLTPPLDRFKSKSVEAQAPIKGIGVVGVAVGNLLSSAFQKVASALSETGKKAISVSDSFVKFNNSMKYLGYGNDEIKKITNSMKTFASDFGVDVEEVIATTSDLASLGVKNFEAVARGTTVLGKAMNLTQEQMNSVNMVLRQTNGIGKLTRENWLQLSEASGTSASAIKKGFAEMGISAEEFEKGLTDGTITAEMFNEVVKKIGEDTKIQELAKQTNTVSGSFTMLKAKAQETFLEVFNLFNGDTVNGENSLLASGINVLTEQLETLTKLLREKQKEIKETLERMKNNILNYLGGFDFSSLITAFNNLWEGLLSGAENFVNLISKPLGTFTTLISSLWNTLSPLLVPLSELFSSVWDTITTVVGTGVSFCIEFINSLITNINWGTITSLISDISTTFKDWFGYISQAYQELKPYLDDLASWLGEKLANAINLALPLIETVWSVFKTLFGYLIEVLPEVIVNIVEFVSETITKFTEMKERVSESWNILKETASGVWEAIKTIISETVENVVTWVTEKWNNAKEITSTIWENLKESISTAINTAYQNVVNTVTNIYNTITTWFSNALTSVENYFTNIKESISTNMLNAWNKVIETVTGLYDSITTWVGNACEWVSNKMSGFSSYFKIDLWSVGYNVISGFWNGIKSCWSRVTEWAKNAVSSLTNTFKRALGIASPSKVFRKIGHWTGEGLAIGLNTSSDLVAKASDKMLGAMNTSEFNTNVGLPKFDMNRTTNVLNNIERPQVIETYTTIELDGKEIGKGTAKFVQAENKRVQKIYDRKRGIV